MHRIALANAKMLTPIAGSGVQNEPMIDLDKIVFKGPMRNPRIVEQRQSRERLGCTHIKFLADSIMPRGVSPSDAIDHTLMLSSAKGKRIYHRDDHNGNAECD